MASAKRRENVVGRAMSTLEEKGLAEMREIALERYY
jgi:hypothetical protein